MSRGSSIVTMYSMLSILEKQLLLYAASALLFIWKVRLNMTPEDYKKIISMAIDREVEAYSFYRTVAETVQDANLKSLFKELAGDETSHREFLQKMLTKDFSSLGFSTTRDYKVAESVASPPLTADLKPIDGLVIAIKKELEAMQMYTGLANATDDAEQKKLFSELAAMERGHKARLEDIYTNMAFPEAW